MKRIKMKWISVMIPLLIGYVSARWVNLQVWIDMSQGLISFMGFLSAALIGVIPITASFIQAEYLTPKEANQLCNQLESQQRYWLGLLSFTTITLVIMIVVSAMHGRTKIIFHGGLKYDTGPLLSFLVAFVLSFVIFKMWAITPGVMSLQRLRTELIQNAAKRAATEHAEQYQRTVQLPSEVVPKDYGKIIQSN